MQDSSTEERKKNIERLMDDLYPLSSAHVPKPPLETGTVVLDLGFRPPSSLSFLYIKYVKVLQDFSIYTSNMVTW